MKARRLPQRHGGRLMSHDPHMGYIIAAYVLGFLMIAGMTGAILVDYLRLKRSLASLDALKRSQGSVEQVSSSLVRQDPEGSE